MNSKPNCNFFSSNAIFCELKEMIRSGAVVLDAGGSCVNSILGKKNSSR